VNELNTRGGRLASLKTGSNIMRMMMRKEDAGNEVPLPRSFIILREKERFELIRSTKFPMICHGGGEVKKQK